MFPHGIMFHRFFDATHPRGQGAIDAETFDRLLARYRDRILPPSEWLRRAKADLLRDDDVCLTFDDALRCQIDVALPVMRDRNVQAFWFVYSSVFEGGAETLEIFRYFRTVAFTDFNHFHAEFSSCATALYPHEMRRVTREAAAAYLTEFPFYSIEDRLYRLARDVALSTQQYDHVLSTMMDQAGFDQQAAKEALWMNNKDLTLLTSEGHSIGLHSYTHPIRIEKLPAELQRSEYERNRQHITSATGCFPLSMSHPCGSYSDVTLKILTELGAEVGFCSSMARGRARTLLEFPREDHANIVGTL